MLTPEGRAERIGVALDCVRCDAFEWPDGMACYRTTPEFTAETTPRGLRADHSTKAGVWGRIVVSAGAVIYVAGPHRWRLTPGDEPGVVVPEMKHHVEPEAGARFVVQFWRPPG